MASLTTREDDLSLHSVQSILLTHEQRLQLQHAVPADLTSITAYLAASSIHPTLSMPTDQINTKSTLFLSFLRTQFTQTILFWASSTPSSFYKKICGKFGHIAFKCYHHFDLSLQDSYQASVSPNPGSTT